MAGDSGGGGNLVRVSAIKPADGLSYELNPDPDGCGSGIGGVPSGEGARAVGLGARVRVRVRCRGGTLEFCDI